MRARVVSVLVALPLIACGSDSNHGADASKPTPDAAKLVDAEPIDAPRGPVTVTLTLDGAGVGSQRVYFLNADSSVVSSTSTGADGTATAMMAAGGSVTVLEPTGSGFVADADTFEAVVPGDQLRVDLRSPPVQPTDATVTLVVPTTANAARYLVETTCDVAGPAVVPAGSGATTAPQAVTLVGCNGFADVLVSTQDAADHFVSSLYTPHVAIANGGTVALTGAYTPYGLSRFTAALDATATATGVGYIDGIYTPSGLVFSLDGSVTLTGGSGSSSIQFPVVQPGEHVIETLVGDIVFDREHAFDWRPTTAADSSFTFAQSEVMPRHTAAPTIDTQTATITWAQGSGAPAVDGTSMLVEDDRGQTSWFWTVVAPATSAATLVLPTLPSDVANYTFLPGDQVRVVAGHSVTVPGGYDAYRPLGINTIDNGREATLLDAFLTNGSDTGSFAIDSAFPEDDLAARARRQRVHR